LKILIPKNKFLSNRSLIYEKSKFFWSCEDDKLAYVLGDEKSKKSINPIFEILSCSPPDLISQKVIDSFSNLGISKHQLPIDAVQSSEEMIENIKNAFSKSEWALNELNALGYLDIFTECNNTLKSLQRAQINDSVLKRELNLKKIKNISVVKGFLPKRDGYLDLPVYSITKTLTGRMTVTSGPQILTAPKSIRKHLRSVYKNGRIAQVDFVSLEPRVAIQLDKQTGEKDVYAYLAKKILDFKVPRSTIKKLVLCSVYGASESTLKKDLPSGTNVKKLIEKTKKELKYDLVVNEQIKNYNKFGKIFNWFGRPITPQSSRESLIYNNYIQSTAVDVALLGFGKIIKKCSNRVRPIFFIHDAMLLDLHPDDIESFRKLSSSVDIEKLGNFPLEFQFVD
jgi:hypothetical protein